ncbi:MAG TPA: phage holin family protein [Candidatus Enterococcus avicola]|uniref:Phage holin family protein n=1 Tax=Candidatus Enterococcus avicola TaxID=2838561 RepID=A0A9D2F897_9ENTE|nr:phage holin family protein [Candidatus Enterococcus avicola]
MEINELIHLMKEQKILYILSLLSVAMMIDFLSGVLAAKMNHEILSKKGINGIIRKIASTILLVFFLPVALIIPGKTGIVLLTVLYLGYLGMEIQSILENYQKMGIPIALFQTFLKQLQQLFSKKD